MSLVFVISLAILIISAYIFKHSADELSYLAAAISGVSLLISLILAPWPIQLLLLIVVLLSNRQQALPSDYLVEPQEEEKAKLTYRGVSYEPTPPPVDVTEAEMTGKYRGQFWKTRNLVKTSETQPSSTPSD